MKSVHDARTHYEVLGVGRNATDAEIKKAYRRLANKFHPDKLSDPTPSDREAFGKILRAYETLIDTDRRKVYDETGRDDPMDRHSDEDVLVDMLLRACQIPNVQNPVDMVREELIGMRKQTERGIANLEEKCRHVEKHAKRIKAKSSAAFHSQLAESLAHVVEQTRRDIAALKSEHDKSGRMLKKLNESIDYESDSVQTGHTHYRVYNSANTFYGNR